MSRKFTTTCCLALLGLTAQAAGQETMASPTGAPGHEIERVSWVGSVVDGHGVTVLNRFGDVRARFGGYEGRVEVFANVQQLAGEGPRLVVEAKESPAGVEVTVGYRTDEAGELVTMRDPDSRKRADMVVYVPRGAPLSASADHGLVDLRGLKSDARATTVSGDIAARKIDGEVALATGSGDVLVALEKWDSARQHSFASGSGDLSITFGGEVSAAIQVATSGLISTDFSMDVDYQADRQPIKRGEALAGKGYSTVTISSTDGHIRLIRRPLARKARVRPGTGR